MSSASSRTNPSGTGCLYWPDADAVSSIAATTRPVHFHACEKFITLRSEIREREGGQRRAGGHQHVLLVVDHVGNRAGVERVAGLEVPQVLAGLRVERH